MVSRLRRFIASRWLPLLAAGVGFATFGLIGLWVHNGPLHWDSVVWRKLDGYENSRTADAALRISHLFAGTYPVVAWILIIVAVLVAFRQIRAAFFVCAATAVILLVPILKDAFQRPPPTTSAERYSFPSGHAISSVAIVAAVVVLLWPTRWRWAALVLGSAYALVVGAAVVLDRGHWPSDVVAGWGLAAAWVAVCTLVIRPRPLGARDG